MKEIKQTALVAAIKSIFAAFMLLLASGAVTSVSAQSALDGFDPNANGTIRAVVVQPDGKILVGGFFNDIRSQSCNNIARLDATTGAADSLQC